MRETHCNGCRRYSNREAARKKSVFLRPPHDCGHGVFHGTGPPVRSAPIARMDSPSFIELVVFTCSLPRIETAEQSVALPVWPRGEIERIHRAAIAAVSESDGPETVNRDSLAPGVAHLVDERPGCGGIGVNAAVAEV